jgi:hypothetical protein
MSAKVSNKGPTLLMKQSLNETSDFESKLQLNQLLNESIGTIADFIK